MSEQAEERARMLALLEHNHTFPGPYSLRVISRSSEPSAIVSAVSAVGAEVADCTAKPSKTGKYMSYHLVVRVNAAEDVLSVYQVVGALEDVLTVL